MEQTGVDIIDPIHDFIRVAPAEQQLVDHPIFQRLRRIRQLSSAYLVYPGAQHTRFEHSLGVMHVAGQAAASLKEKGLIGYSHVEDLRLAGLLHDVGHGPFSHHFEELTAEKGGKTHEEIGMEIIERSEIGDLLSSSGYDRHLISRLAAGRSRVPFMNEIISGALSADMMDYLLRDAYYTGAEHAKIAHQRVTRSLNVHRRRLALERSAIYSLETMLHSRYQMFRAVYYHKAVRAAEVILLESIRLADDHLNLTSAGLDEYLQLTDDTVLTSLASLPETEPRLRKSRRLALDYRNRRLPKCAYERILMGPEKPVGVDREDLRAAVADRAQVSEDEIFVDSLQQQSVPTLPRQQSPSIVFVSGRGRESRASTVPISQIRLISPMSGSMDILRVYTGRKNRKKVEMAATALLDGAAP